MPFPVVCLLPTYSLVKVLYLNHQTQARSQRELTRKSHAANFVSCWFCISCGVMCLVLDYENEQRHL